MAYVETGCVFEHDGRSFESGGAVVTAERAIAYPAAGGILNDWHGRPLGAWRATSSWRVNSYMGTRMYQIQARINGVLYTGRGFGEGCIWTGRRMAGQS